MAKTDVFIVENEIIVAKDTGAGNAPWAYSQHRR